jgi:hypothetical protein
MCGCNVACVSMHIKRVCLLSLNSNHVESYITGSTYTGQWLDNDMHGKGKFDYACGAYYRGNIVHNIKTGKGIFTWPTGNQYTGDFVNNELMGTGEMKYANGHRYVGAWERSRKNGYGVFYYSLGHIYEGQWLDDERHGKGKLTFVPGTPLQETYEVRWSDESATLLTAIYYRYILRVPLRILTIHYFIHDAVMVGRLGARSQAWQRYTDFSAWHMFIVSLTNGCTCFVSPVLIINQANTHTARMKACPMTVCVGIDSNHAIKPVQVFCTTRNRPTIFLRLLYMPCTLGDWDNDVRHGKGLLKYDDGSYYRGDISREQMWGRGVYVSADGSQYDGKEFATIASDAYSRPPEPSRQAIQSGRLKNIIDYVQIYLLYLYLYITLYARAGEWRMNMRQGMGTMIGSHST